MGEHSPCDALVPSIVCEYAIVQEIDGDAFDEADAEASFAVVKEANVQGWERLEWVTDEFVKTECGEVEKRAMEIIADSDDGVLWYAEYGTDWIKSVGALL